ncbi:hypothetical protein MKEN_00711600 [Mycena kentingensis (nom. inval.)]|nr:hypothetical protein MKEN_00711600 [Mycena kentingensis (nom. inval.)]
MVFSYGTVPSSARTMEETTPRKSACSNLQCLNITPNNVAKRCSGCKVLHYCSKDCQRIDWKEGNHRAFCDMYGLSRNFFTSPFHQFSKKQRTWLWKIAHTLFRDRTKYTLNQHIEFFSRFNLSSAPPQAITLVGPKTLRNTIGEPNGTFVMQATALSAVDSPLAVSLRSAGKDWVDLVSRADKSKGRMNLCVLSIREAGEMVNLVYPVYSSWNIRAVALRLAALKQQGVDGKAFEEALNAELKAVGRKAGDALIPDVEYPLLSGA